MNLTIDAVLGCLVGGALGDAAGSAFENRSSRSVSDSFDFDYWRLSDDTQLTLATCEGLMSGDSLDPATVADSYLRWYRQRRLSGLGASTLKSLRDLEAGNHWALAGRQGERAAGNGAAMRVAPIAFLADPSIDDDRRFIRDVSRTTHHHDEAYVGALAVVFAIRFAQDGLALSTLASNLPDTLVRDRLRDLDALGSAATISEAALRFGVSGYVVESVPLAIFAAQRCETIGYTAMLHELLAVGGDTDTNASIAGQIAGARIGFDSLPRELVDKLPEREMVLEIANQFAKYVEKRLTKPLE